MTSSGQSVVENVDVAEFHLRVEDRIDVLNTKVATSLRVSAVELDAARDTSVDRQWEHTQLVLRDLIASSDLRRPVSDAYLKGVENTCRNANIAGDVDKHGS